MARVPLQGGVGPTGPQGAQGPAGPQGPQGAQGPLGPTGPEGPAGAVGPSGLVWRGAWSSGTSYVVDDAVSHGGFAWIAAAPSTNDPPPSANWTELSSPGATGPAGPQGPAGAQGAAGAKGDTGAQGPAGPTGPQGVPGATGPTGATGPAGSSSAAFGAQFGWVTFDSFAGANDDTKLNNAIAYVKSQVGAPLYPPDIYCSNRQHIFATVGRDPDPAVVLVGPGLKFNAADSSNKQNRNFEIQLNFDSSLTGVGWWHLTDTAAKRRGFGLVDLCFVNNSSTLRPSVVTQSAGAKGFGTAKFENITAIGMWSVLGYVNPQNDKAVHGSTPASQPLLGTATRVLSGPDGNINGGYSTQVYVGGSGLDIFPDGGLLDSPDSRHPGNGAPIMRIDTSEETNVGPVYITCEGRWHVEVNGPAYNTSHSNPGGPVNFFGTRMEGQLSVNPSFGAVFIQVGGIVNMFGVIVQYGMAAPASTGRSPADTAYMMVSAGGVLNVVGLSTDKAGASAANSEHGALGAVAESVPLIAASGAAVVNVQMVTHFARFGVWSGLPVVHDGTSSPGLVTCDATVTKT